jgi:hypothetical protein
MEVNIKVKLKTPMTPNYISLAVGENENFNQVSIASLTDEQLDEIGKQWAADLKLRAAKIRLNK